MTDLEKMELSLRRLADRLYEQNTVTAGEAILMLAEQIAADERSRLTTAEQG